MFREAEVTGKGAGVVMIGDKEVGGQVASIDHRFLLKQWCWVLLTEEIMGAFSLSFFDILFNVKCKSNIFSG